MREFWSICCGRRILTSSPWNCFTTLEIANTAPGNEIFKIPESYLQRRGIMMKPCECVYGHGRDLPCNGPTSDWKEAEQIEASTTIQQMGLMNCGTGRLTALTSLRPNEKVPLSDVELTWTQILGYHTIPTACGQFLLHPGSQAKKITGNTGDHDGPS